MFGFVYLKTTKTNLTHSHTTKSIAHLIVISFQNNNRNIKISRWRLMRRVAPLQETSVGSKKNYLLPFMLFILYSDDTLMFCVIMEMVK